MASSSSVSVFDNYRFKTAFNEEFYNTIVKNKKNVFLVQHDQQLDRVLADLCIPGATWKLSTGQQRVPIQLRRQELNPIARGWHELSIHSLILSSNRSEIPVIRAILIHCIMNGDDVRAEDIIADKMEAGVPLREFRRTKKIPVEKPITARRMESTRLPRQLQHQQQDNEDEDQPMPQAEERNEEGQGYEHDYHHQPEFDHQPGYDHQQDFQDEPQFQQPPLYEVPTYTDQHEKDLHSIETQLQNMMWYQQQTLENINKSQAEYMAELRLIKGKQQEIEQHANFSEMQRQLKEWTRNSSARECYSVWAHQQANPNLVEMPVHKVTRPMFYGFLKSNLQPSETAPPPPKSNDPQNAPN
ncbi:hypothetical protein PIB30_085209 [Stylosanthes scabra]|uniref:Putative plant transposon protein domain-containing protein n=1 Tax=Stylosanthes scabra TaxID=79078 RepID=A0ABU6ST25_9FABA|nr:hypothetical protein [Stylosanthes scabra]